MKNQPNVNGVTFNQMTSLMNKAEKIIMWYNRKYNFDMSLAKAKEQKEYSNMQELWERVRTQRDSLKTAAFAA
jgi:U3 small nucleolar ribonucleoprotein component